MSEPAAQNPTELLESPLLLRELLDAPSLDDILASFYALFRLPVRVLDERGGALARTRKQAELNEYLGELPGAAKRLEAEHLALRIGDLGERGELFHTAFTGASYYVGAIGHEGRCIGRFILGPFLSPDVGDAPEQLLGSEPSLDLARVRDLLSALPRVREETVKAIARHLAVTFDALIFTGYRARLSEHMHLSSVHENGRQLSEAGRKLRAEELHRAENQRLQGKLLGAISEEMREPVKAMLLDAERWASSVSPDQADVVARVRREAGHLCDLAERLHHLSRVEGGFVLQKQEVDPAALLDRARATLGSALPGGAQRLRVTLEGGLPRLWADPARLLDALRLLGENALRVQGEGPVVLGVRRVSAGSGREAADVEGLVLLGAPPEAVEFSVADSGPRIPEPERERVFEAFYELGGGRTGHIARSGLNLAIVKRLVEAHEGNVRIEDNPPCGAVFVVTLPLAAPGLDV